ncbi:TIGR01777 family oxidoreductase [Nocardioides terrisoli]|uniref:TIGR01777 family oxidoreductase n=1 Tax=Nocardioides terrisoli TaxID=3388267 RepID=UPI00287BA6C4|nr:TIGR01777 family oxidoreductase [Nocardioides marmorisolisilvae]
MHALIAGSSGFLGNALVEHLTGEGHRVTRLVRRTAGSGERRWDPYAGPLDPDVLADVDVVVNLAGSPTFGNPRSRKWARNLRDSRVTTTRALAEAIASGAHRPALLAGNGISWYGDHGDQPLTEDADTRGHSLLTDVTREWQQATEAAAEVGARVVVLRTAPVLDAASPPLKQLRILFSLGLGGPIDAGHQFFPVISRRDWVGAVAHLATGEASGPVNLCAPRTPTNADFTTALANALHRPAMLRVPSAAIRLAAGPMAPELLGSVRAVPQRLLDDGYEFADPDVRSILAAAFAPAAPGRLSR